MTRDLYERHYEELMRYCLQLCRSREMALDLVQETFLKALEREEVMETFSPEQQRSWLYRAAKNLFLDGVRKSALLRRKQSPQASQETRGRGGALQERERGLDCRRRHVRRPPLRDIHRSRRELPAA